MANSIIRRCIASPAITMAARGCLILHMCPLILSTHGHSSMETRSEIGVGPTHVYE